jgi:hypothetical protein
MDPIKITLRVFNKFYTYDLQGSNIEEKKICIGLIESLGRIPNDVIGLIFQALKSEMNQKRRKN